jgi:hypothetical protein
MNDQNPTNPTSNQDGADEVAVATDSSGTQESPADQKTRAQVEAFSGSKLLAWAADARVTAKSRVFVRTHVDLNRYGKKATFEFFGSSADAPAAHEHNAISYWRESLGQEVIVLQTGTPGNPYAYLAVEMVLCKTVRVTDMTGGNLYVAATSVEIKESYIDGVLLDSSNISVVGADDSATGKLKYDKTFSLVKFDLAATAKTALLHEVVLQAELQVKIGGTDYTYLVDPGIIIAPKRP